MSDQSLGNSCGGSSTDFQGKLLYSLMVKKSFPITKSTLLCCSLSLLLLSLGTPENKEWTTLTDQGTGWLGNNFACKGLGDIVDSEPNMSQQHTLAAKKANSIPRCIKQKRSQHVEGRYYPSLLSISLGPIGILHLQHKNDMNKQSSQIQWRALKVVGGWSSCPAKWNRACSVWRRDCFRWTWQQSPSTYKVKEIEPCSSVLHSRRQRDNSHKLKQERF